MSPLDVATVVGNSVAWFYTTVVFSWVTVAMLGALIVAGLLIYLTTHPVWHELPEQAPQLLEADE